MQKREQKDLAKSKKCSTFAPHFPQQRKTMINRTVDMIFKPSGMPVPTEEEVRFEAREIVQRCGWGLPLIEALRKMADPYWCEAVTRCLMEKWRELMRDKDEQTYYYDSDGDVRYCWMDAEYDFCRIIRRCTAEQVELEQVRPSEPATWQPSYCYVQPVPHVTQVFNQTNFHIGENNAPIITDSNVTFHKH